MAVGCTVEIGGVIPLKRGAGVVMMNINGAIDSVDEVDREISN